MAFKHLLNKKKRQVHIDSVTSKGNTPLFLACQSGNAEVVKELLLRHANIGLRCQRDDTCLHVLLRQLKKPNGEKE